MDQILKLDRFVNNVSNQKIQDELTDKGIVSTSRKKTWIKLTKFIFY